MTVKQQGGIFGRNPTFNNVDIEGDLSVAGTLSVNGNVLSGLDFEGAWDATSGAPSATPSTGQFWIVSVAGTTNLSGITNWGIGDWALYDGSAWQRIEGGADGNFKQLTSSSTTVLNGTTIPASKTLVVTTDIGSTVQAYDADTAKLDANQTWTGTQAFNGAVVINEAGADVDFRIESDANTHALFVDAGNSRVGINADSPSGVLHLAANTDLTTLPSIVLQDSGTTSTRLGSLTNSSGDIMLAATASLSDIRASIVVKDDRSAVIATAGTGRLTVNSSGNVVVETGNLVIGTSGQGIDFSATSGTGTSELFDDYEEGTWTPSAGANLAIVGTPTYSGEYTKIGNTVTVWGSVTATTSVSYTAGGQLLSGLPYASQGIAAAGSIYNASNSASAIKSLPTTNFIYGTEAMGASTGIFFQLTYHV